MIYLASCIIVGIFFFFAFIIAAAAIEETAKEIPEMFWAWLMGALLYILVLCWIPTITVVITALYGFCFLKNRYTVKK